MNIQMGVMLAALLALLSLAGTARAANIAKLEEMCASCHGKDGASTESDVPIIGGMSEGYLVYNLTAYTKRDRPCSQVAIKSGVDKDKKTDMCEATKNLSEAEINDLAKFYAGKKFVRAAQKFDPALAAKGKAIHQQLCEKCHLNDGTEAKNDAGLLAGQWSPYLRQTFQEYASGKRYMEQKMKPKMQKLDNEGIEALINYYASVP